MLMKKEKSSSQLEHMVRGVKKPALKKAPKVMKAAARKAMKKAAPKAAPMDKAKQNAGAEQNGSSSSCSSTGAAELTADQRQQIPVTPPWLNRYIPTTPVMQNYAESWLIPTRPGMQNAGVDALQYLDAALVRVREMRAAGGPRWICSCCGKPSPKECHACGARPYFWKREDEASWH